MIIEKPLGEENPVCGVYLMNQSFFVYSKLQWARHDMRGAMVEKHEFTDVNGNEWELLCELLQL